MSTLVTQQELDRRRQLRLARVRKADRLNIAIGWVSEDGKLMRQANGAEPPKLPKAREGR